MGYDIDNTPCCVRDGVPFIKTPYYWYYSTSYNIVYVKLWPYQLIIIDLNYITALISLIDCQIIIFCMQSIYIRTK